MLVGINKKEPGDNHYKTFGSWNNTNIYFNILN